SFNDYFDMVPATTESLKLAVYRLRYQVFCLETGFEDKDCFPGKLEMDEYDRRSEHYLIRHRQSGVYAATTRIILPDTKNPESLFPIERHCSLTTSHLLEHIPRECLGEVSRFCVSGFFKRRPGEKGTLAGIGPQKHQYYHSTEEERRCWPHITLALIACLNRINLTHVTTHLYALMEPSLVRMLNSIGITFLPIGPLTDYHGIRQPCIIKVPDYLEKVKEKNFHVWEMLTDCGNFWRNERDVA
ncbi:MAG TPA: PEP-CTERM/exosortase system-associated acyltransferase, partial [Anaerolineae bacterium]|nr:PEP-CTERM/exosortase system-associated acyltransferase [Anaerolineae bacterium]